MLLMKRIVLWIFLTLISNKLKSVLMCCDPLVPLSNFNASKFAGNWNVYAVDRKQEVINCLVKQFRVVDSTTLVVNDKFRYSQNNTVGISTSRILLGDKNLGFWTNTDATRIEIIDTDYTNFAVCASCTSPLGSNIWVLTRSVYVDNLTKYRIANVLYSINFSPNYLIETPFDLYTCDGYSLRPTILLILIILLTGNFILFFFN